ncbi:MAG TPA: tetratricopeptide repeat protein [Thermoanaerobaculia bacterium]|nr:tetratricopeptide repeat protein [Thermoanaerobaculia bacterium]
MPAETIDVFFSYNHKDRETVRRVADELRRQGVRVWMDDEALPLGQPWHPHVEAALQEARSTAILLGPSGYGDWQREEAGLCLDQGVKRHIPVIPILLPGGPSPEGLPDFLRGRTCSDLREEPWGDRLQRLVREIRGKTVPSPAKEEAVQPLHGPKVHNLPFLPLGDLFKGRDEELRALEANFCGSTGSAVITQIQVIHGLGGMGKTRLAVEYAWRSGDRYEAALFVVADSPEALRSGLADRLDTVPETEVATIFSWIRTHDRWLLILDNVDAEETARAARKLLPQLQAGHVLITSRRRNWPASLKNRALKELSLEEATQFLLQRTEGLRAATESDPEQACQLAQHLDGLPLALEQAAAYICHHQITFSQYSEIWENVLGWYDGDLMDYPASLAATWQTTFRQLGLTAAALLRLAAYLAPEPLPLEMFEKGSALVIEAVSLLGEEVGPAGNGVPQPIQESISELAAFSMVTRDVGTLTVHRMVQEVLRSHVPEPCRRDWIELALRLVNDFSPAAADDIRTWPAWDVLWPHAAEVSRYADDMRIANPTSGLMRKVYLYLSAKGLYAEAEPLILRSLAIAEEIAPDSSEVAIRLNDLAQLLQATNRLAEAEPLMRRALKIDESALGPDHPEVATDLNNLAFLLKATNRLAEAELLMRRALKIDENALGPDHPDVATDLNNLAQLLQAANRLAEAEPLMRRAVQLYEAHLGADHPNLVPAINNLAQLLQSTDQLAAAEPLMRRALQIDEAAFGPDHPNVARDLNNLALLLQAKNRLAEAEPLMRRALQIDETAFGPDHPNVARDLNNLALLLQATSRLAEAEPAIRRAVEIYQIGLGPEDPRTLNAKTNLGSILAELELEVTTGDSGGGTGGADETASSLG